VGTKIAKLGIELECNFDPKQCNILQYIDDLESGWAQMAVLSCKEELDDEQKIWCFKACLSGSGYESFAAQAEFDKDGDTWWGFIRSFKSLVQYVDHNAWPSHAQPLQTKIS